MRAEPVVPAVGALQLALRPAARAQIQPPAPCPQPLDHPMDSAQGNRRQKPGLRSGGTRPDRAFQIQISAARRTAAAQPPAAGSLIDPSPPGATDIRWGQIPIPAPRGTTPPSPQPQPVATAWRIPWRQSHDCLHRWRSSKGQIHAGLKSPPGSALLRAGNTRAGLQWGARPIR